MNTLIIRINRFTSLRFIYKPAAESIGPLSKHPVVGTNIEKFDPHKEPNQNGELNLRDSSLRAGRSLRIFQKTDSVKKQTSLRDGFWPYLDLLFSTSSSSTVISRYPIRLPMR